jgi:hypothetical protein
LAIDQVQRAAAHRRLVSQKEGAEDGGMNWAILHICKLVCIAEHSVGQSQLTVDGEPVALQVRTRLLIAIPKATAETATDAINTTLSKVKKLV